MTDLKNQEGKGIGGFTLVEVLVAAALLAFLLPVLLGAVRNTTIIASQTNSQIEVSRNAREVFDLIGRDIALAASSAHSGGSASLQFLVNPPIAKTSGFANRDSFFFQAPLSRNHDLGNLAIVGYFVLRDATVGAQRMQLRRVFIEPNSQNSDYKIYAPAKDWITESILRDFAPSSATEDNAKAQKGWVADGVIGMWVRCMDKRGTVISNAADQGFDSLIGFQGSNSYWYPANQPFYPSFIEVTLVCVNPGEVDKIINLGVLPATSPAPGFSGDISTYVNQFRVNNPGAKSVAAFTRKFRVFTRD